MLESLLRNLLPLLEPIGLLWTCLLIVTAFLIRQRQQRFAGVLGVLVVFVWLVGATSLPHRLLASLERPWAGVKRADLPQADAIVLLGGFAAPSQEEVGGLHFDRNADRAVTALELVRLGKARTLVIGGGFAPGGESFREADRFKEFISVRQLAPPDVVSLGHCRDTRHEAEKVAALGRERGWRRVLLVTSAAHMTRAFSTFRTTTSLEIVPAPAGFLPGVSLPAPRNVSLVPRATGFVLLENWLHETVGWSVYRWRGWVAPDRR